MDNKTQKKSKGITRIDDIKINKLKIFFKRSILRSILRILVMDYAGFRTFKSVKNINRLFTNIDLTKYKGKQELESYIWCICYISKQWLSGIENIDLILSMMVSQDTYDNIKGDIIKSCREDKDPVSNQEVKAIFDLISEALQIGYVVSLKEEYISLLDDINLDQPGSFRALAERLFQVSQSLLDIKHNTNIVVNKVEFNSADYGSVSTAISDTISSLIDSGAIYKTGITRLNTLLSPGYMNGRLYVYMGLPAGGKSIILLKSALDIRRYNLDVKPKTKGMKPCVLYITMENSFTETIERVWNMTFDDPMVNYDVEQAVEMICNELGISRVINETTVVSTSDNKTRNPLALDKEPGKRNMEIVLQYYPYRSINTDDLFTIMADLRDEGLEVSVLIFDYIKRIEPSVPVHDNVKLELNKIINELKALAVIQDIPVITAHQLNRSAASIVDAAVRQGKGDVNRMVGRENVGDA